MGTNYHHQCVCCLATDSNFVNLTMCKHTTFFQVMFKFKIEYKNAVVCYLCHSLLKKFENFKQLVERNCGQISQVPHVEKDTLECSTVHIVDSTEGNRRFEDKNDIYIDQATFEVTVESVEVKSEKYSSDDDNDVPLSVIKKESAPKTKKTRRGRNLLNKYDGKIKLVTLSKTELALERDRERQKEAYAKLPFKCESCITGFDYEVTLQRHLDRHHREYGNGVTCPICQSTFISNVTYQMHAKRHTRRYECSECGNRTIDVYASVRHYNHIHSTEDNVIEDTFNCDQCPFTTNCNRSYRYHREKHKKKEQCKVCGNAFVHHSALLKHMLSVHKESRRQYACAQCGKTYSGKSGLHAHMARHAPRVFACSACGHASTSRAALRRHVVSAHEQAVVKVDKFVCDECGDKFKTKNTLQEHIDWVHLKVIKHKCSYCDKAFKSSRSLKKHTDFVHLKLRPPRDKMCDHCGRGFTTRTILESHIRTHTGARPLHCPLCSATFAHNAALYTHKKLVHKVEKQATSR